MVGSEEARRVATIVLSALGRGYLELPAESEREPGFTARVLMPRVREALRNIGIPGLTLTGDGAAAPPVTALPSCLFRPDIALLYQRTTRMVAFEVKFLRASGRQYSLAAAIGQAVIYRSQGFHCVGLIFIDMAPVPGEAEAVHVIVTSLGLVCQIYSRSGAKLNVHRRQP